MVGQQVDQRLAPVSAAPEHRTGRFTRLILRFGVHDHDVWAPDTLNLFTAPFTEPDRARAGVRLYRTFNLREFPPIVRGRYSQHRLTVPTRIVFGTRDAFISHKMLNGHQPHADDLDIHLIPDCGHFIADERPDIVADHARTFFAT